MGPDINLEKYIEYALTGTLQIKGEEKKYWLGEFRERVVFALTYDQIHRREALKIVQEKLKDQRVDKMIIHSGVQQAVAEKYMDLANRYGKDYKTIDMQNPQQEIALVLASHHAVNEEKVIMQKMPLMPEKFYRAKNKKLCKKHMEELLKEAPMFAEEFEEITFFDKMSGRKCGVCVHQGHNGVMFWEHE